VDAKTFFIVGGSSGIGLEIVNQLHKMGPEHVNENETPVDVN